MANGNSVMVIGGGAAGLVAAIAACRAGAAVTLVEKNERVGRKLLATGNGRCNYTNIDLDISHFRGSDPRFAYGALKRLDYEKTIAFFAELGIVPRVEDGRVYPRSNQASSVVDVLGFELDQLGVTTIVDFTVSRVTRDGAGFVVEDADGRRLHAQYVILAVGGQASPQLGSDGSGLRFAAELGHHIIEPVPALVQLHLDAGFLKQVDGVRTNARVAVVVRGKRLIEEYGEILFTSYGLSGIPVMQVSRTAALALQRGEEVWLHLCLYEELQHGDLESLLRVRLDTQPQKGLAFSFTGMLNKQLAPVVLREAGIIDVDKPAKQVSSSEKARINKQLLDWPLRVTGTNPWSAAQTTAGGVDVREIDPKTMQSRLVPGLYFAGEIIDIDGDCGGYNLQWAWSSGFAAGESAGLASRKQ